MLKDTERMMHDRGKKVGLKLAQFGLNKIRSHVQGIIKLLLNTTTACFACSYLANVLFQFIYLSLANIWPRTFLEQQQQQDSFLRPVSSYLKTR